METKQQAIKFLEGQKHRKQYFTNKYYSKSYKVFHTDTDVSLVEDFLRKVADKNHCQLIDSLEETFSRSRGYDFFEERKGMVNENWSQYAFEQYAIYTTALNVLEMVLEEIDDELVYREPLRCRFFVSGEFVRLSKKIEQQMTQRKKDE